MKIPHSCPVCSGNVLVPNGFYMQTLGTLSTTDATPEKCRSCKGTGIVWSEETEEESVDDWQKLLKTEFNI